MLARCQYNLNRMLCDYWHRTRSNIRDDVQSATLLRIARFVRKMFVYGRGIHRPRRDGGMIPHAVWRNQWQGVAVRAFDFLGRGCCEWARILCR